ncbi:glycosyl transferase [Aureimonas endophytica]|uniref:Glycosyl transferase n=1 Tax=Aureimonas endophytica TaxID=2027858 RepID=A0A916ZDY4_9HYPH|nr:glycosyltransferase [Aureimonas endophytica]GGD89028.1 glycosyl transferase [Aureimonas endophytica]
MIAVVCMKWGTAFGPDYVNVLYRGVAAHLSQPFRFYCFTDDPAGLSSGIIARPLPDSTLSADPDRRWHGGRWPKIGLFRPGLIAEDQALYLDLDVVITGGLDPLVERQRSLGGLHILREWSPGLWNLLPLALRPDRGAQSSVFAWRPSEQHHLYEALHSAPDRVLAAFRNDQQFIGHAAAHPHYWPQGWAVSFKKHCVWHYPLNLVFPEPRKPAGARIVVFHGKPRPHQVAREGNRRWGTRRRFGFGPVSWVRDYWSDRPSAAPAAASFDFSDPTEV